jgi:hypothetical protein
MTELLTAPRENRRGKGLYVEPTDHQVMQIWCIRPKEIHPKNSSPKDPIGCEDFFRREGYVNDSLKSLVCSCVSITLAESCKRYLKQAKSPFRETSCRSPRRTR